MSLRVASRERSSSQSKRLVEEEHETSDLTGDYFNVFILLVLYTLQGVPLGLSAAIPLILQEHGASLSDLGTFSFVSWPFSLKILWAPIVDSLFFSRFGLRKSWLIPSQMCIAAILLFGSTRVEDLLGVSGGSPDVWTLTILFFSLYFLCATQDIAVDGWALTILQRRNVSYASTTNAAGQSLGNALAFVGYFILDHYKLMGMAGFMRLWGVIFIVVTVIVAFLKKEEPATHVLPLREAYSQMIQVLRCPGMLDFAIFHLTYKAPFAVADSITGVKMQAAGMPKDHLAFLGVLLMPVGVLLPGLISSHTSGRKPLSLILRWIPVRLCLGLLAMLIVYCAPRPWPPTVPWGLYAAFLAVLAVFTAVSNTMFVAQMAFFARVSDPRIGGTYMTLLNTIANLGGKWPNSLVFFLVGWSTRERDGVVEVDGYYVWGLISALLGGVWLFFMRDLTHRLQSRPAKDWRVS